MTPEESNQIIENYMESYPKYPNGEGLTRKYYWISLDSLVPVWEKLKFDQLDIIKGIGPARGLFFSTVMVNNENYDGGEQPTIQEAAAIATAKAIKELTKSD